MFDEKQEKTLDAMLSNMALERSEMVSTGSLNLTFSLLIISTIQRCRVTGELKLDICVSNKSTVLGCPPDK